MSRSVWYKKRDDLLYLLNKIDIREPFNDYEEERFENYLDKTRLIAYYTHDKDSLTDEYKQMCEIKTNRYEMQKLHEEMNEDRRKNEETKQSS